MGPMEVTRSGTFHYMCTRNNNFSNRSQKGRIIVVNGNREAQREQVQRIPPFVWVWNYLPIAPFRQRGIEVIVIMSVIHFGANW